MENTPDAILEFAIEQAKEEWKKTKSPYFLARLDPALNARGVNYREVLSGQKLGDFFRSCSDRIKVVSHPNQKSKIGLIPAEENFTFSAEVVPSDQSTSNNRHNKSATFSHRRYIVTHFLQMISELEDKDSIQVNIPTHILAKLIQG